MVALPRFITRAGRIHLNGFCDANFEPVKFRVEKMLKYGLEDNLQLCVYANKKCVVDLHGTAINDLSYTADTVQPIYSTSKCLESIIMGMLYGKGLFEYDEKISKYWPEFSQNGKGDVKISDVLRHQSGLAYFSEAMPISMAWRENIKRNEMGKFIEKQELHFPKSMDGTQKVEYHQNSRGFILNEIVRRIDPKGRTMGEILQDDINIKGVYLGESCEPNSDPVPLRLIPKSLVFSQSLTPKFLGKKVDVQFIELIKKFIALDKMQGKQPSTFLEQKGLKVSDQKHVDLYTSPNFVKSEIPSINVRANARSLAYLASTMANRGQGLIPESAWEEMHSEPKYERIGASEENRMHFNFNKGGSNVYKNGPEATPMDINGFNKDRDGYIGWMGVCGSIMQWHPELQIGFAFVPTFFNPIDRFNERGGALQQIVKDCILGKSS